MSMVRLSHPECAITSAEKELGTCSHPFTAVSPSRQIFLRGFSLILDPLLPRLGCLRVASHAPIHPGSRPRSPPRAKDTSEPPVRTSIAARYGAVEPASTLARRCRL